MLKCVVPLFCCYEPILSSWRPCVCRIDFQRHLPFYKLERIVLRYIYVIHIYMPACLPAFFPNPGTRLNQKARENLPRGSFATNAELRNVNDIERGETTRRTQCYTPGIRCASRLNVITLALRQCTYRVSRAGRPSNKPAGSVVSWFRKTCLVKQAPYTQRMHKHVQYSRIFVSG